MSLCGVESSSCRRSPSPCGQYLVSQGTCQWAIRGRCENIWNSFGDRKDLTVGGELGQPSAKRLHRQPDDVRHAALDGQQRIALFFDRVRPGTADPLPRLEVLIDLGV